MSDRNLKIGQTFKQTKEKRKSQVCKVFRFKVDRSSLSRQQSETLKMMFIEAKWIYNYLLTVEDIFHFDYKNLTTITRKDRYGDFIPADITHLSASNRQSIITQIQSQIKNLSRLKKKGHKVGPLKFKSEFKSINLKQYGMTHQIVGTNKFKLQGISRLVRVNGLDQLSKYSNPDYANAHLIYDGCDYYVALTCYLDKPTVAVKPRIGLDMGCRTTITLSDGQKFDVQVGETERLKRLQAKLSRQQNRSNNWYKTNRLIRKEYVKMMNRKRDCTNKILSYLDQYDIVMQDEQLGEWKEGMNTTKIQHSALGRIKTVLVSRPGTIVLDQWLPTTKWCPVCEKKNYRIRLGTKTFRCPDCGLKEDRDVHAAKNMLYFYREKDRLGTSQTSKLVRTTVQAGRYEASASC